MKGVSESVLLFAGFHLVGGIVLLASLYVLALRRLIRRAFGTRMTGSIPAGQTLEFGWGPEWMNGLAVAAIVTLAAAVAIEVSAARWWPLAFVLVLLGACFLIGNFIMRSFRSIEHIVLPMVKLLSGGSDRVLDA